MGCLYNLINILLKTISLFAFPYLAWRLEEGGKKGNLVHPSSLLQEAAVAGSSRGTTATVTGSLHAALGPVGLVGLRGLFRGSH